MIDVQRVVHVGYVTHYHHANIIRFCKRPYANIDEMNEALIANYNARVGVNDDTYHLGDFALKCREVDVENIVRRLNGKIHLILGNHDRNSVRKARGFVEQVDYKELKINGQYIIMSHYPFLTWNKRHHGSMAIHGHSHGSIPRDMTEKRLDIGVDCWNYAPISLDEVLTEMAKVTPKSFTRYEED